MNGVIKCINDKGFGFITSDDGKEYFFHASGLNNAKIEDLNPGDKVQFTLGIQRGRERAQKVYVTK